MRKKRVFFMVFFFSTGIFAKAALLKKLALHIEHNPKNPQHRTQTLFYLEKTEQGISCKTEGIPQHAIQIKEFDTLEKMNTTFRKVLAEPPPACETLLSLFPLSMSQEKAKICYRKYEILWIDEVIRQCLNI